MIVNVFFIGCSESEDCIKDLDGEVVTIKTHSDASNALAAIYSMYDFNNLTIQNVKPVSIIKTDLNSSLQNENNISIYGGDTYSYTLSNYSLSNHIFTITLLEDFKIKGKSQFQEDANKTSKSASLSGDMNVTINSSQEKISLIYDDYQYMYKKEGNESAEQKINGLFSYKSLTKQCKNGIYQIETIAPLLESINGRFYDGELNINGTIFKFNEGESADVVFADGSVIYGVSALESSCE